MVQSRRVARLRLRLRTCCACCAPLSFLLLVLRSSSSRWVTFVYPSFMYHQPQPATVGPVTASYAAVVRDASGTVLGATMVLQANPSLGSCSDGCLSNSFAGPAARALASGLCVARARVGVVVSKAGGDDVCCVGGGATLQQQRHGVAHKRNHDVGNGARSNRCGVFRLHEVILPLQHFHFPFHWFTMRVLMCCTGLTMVPMEVCTTQPLLTTTMSW